ncbi:hypothetical protein KEM55_002545 [Ascosphaera atra]|nr:hypothetical protein KEM55_002545 [Ascosphaera atra]
MSPKARRALTDLSHNPCWGTTDDRKAWYHHPRRDNSFIQHNDEVLDDCHRSNHCVSAYMYMTPDIGSLNNCSFANENMVADLQGKVTEGPMI